MLLLQRKRAAAMALAAEGDDAAAVVEGITAARCRRHRPAQLRRPVGYASDRRSRAACVGVRGILVEPATGARGRRLRLMEIVSAVAVGMLLPQRMLVLLLLLLLLLSLRVSRRWGRRTTGRILVLMLLLLLLMLLLLFLLLLLLLLPRSVLRLRLLSSLEAAIVVAECRVECPLLRLLLLPRAVAAMVRPSPHCCCCCCCCVGRPCIFFISMTTLA